MKRFLISTLFILQAILNVAVSATFNKVVAFGDSLSDNGNLYQYSYHIVPKSPPYFEGRFSNEAIWVERLVKDYFNSEDVLEDYAVGGAGAILSKDEVLPYTLKHEVDNFFNAHQGENFDKTLFIVWIGGNNYLNGPNEVDELTTQVVQGIRVEVERLVNNGAMNILLGNLPDIGATPTAKEAGTQQITHQLSVEHNRKLYKLYQDLQQLYPAVHFVYFDAYSHFEEVMNHPSVYGIVNVSDACYLGGYYWGFSSLNPHRSAGNVTPEQLKQYVREEAARAGKTLNSSELESYVSNPSLREAVKNGYLASHATFEGTHHMVSQEPLQCDGYFFWDHVHPTGYVHRLLANYMKAQLEQQGLTAAK